MKRTGDAARTSAAPKNGDGEALRRTTLGRRGDAAAARAATGDATRSRATRRGGDAAQARSASRARGESAPQGRAAGATATTTRSVSMTRGGEAAHRRVATSGDVARSMSRTRGRIGEAPAACVGVATGVAHAGGGDVQRKRAGNGPAPCRRRAGGSSPHAELTEATVLVLLLDNISKPMIPEGARHEEGGSLLSVSPQVDAPTEAVLSMSRRHESVPPCHSRTAFRAAKRSTAERKPNSFSNSLNSVTSEISGKSSRDMPSSNKRSRKISINSACVNLGGSSAAMSNVKGALCASKSFNIMARRVLAPPGVGGHRECRRDAGPIAQSQGA